MKYLLAAIFVFSITSAVSAQCRPGWVFDDRLRMCVPGREPPPGYPPVADCPYPFRHCVDKPWTCCRY